MKPVTRLDADELSNDGRWTDEIRSVSALVGLLSGESRWSFIWT